jgi:hypothetical protein
LPVNADEVSGRDRMSWTPTTTKWEKVITRLAPKNPDGTVYYRIDCKDALGRKTRGEVRTLQIVQ